MDADDFAGSQQRRNTTPSIGERTCVLANWACCFSRLASAAPDLPRPRRWSLVRGGASISATAAVSLHTDLQPRWGRGSLVHGLPRGANLGQPFAALELVFSSIDWRRLHQAARRPRGAIEAAAQPLGITVMMAPVHDDAAIEEAIAAMARAPRGGLVIPPDPFAYSHRSVTIAAAAYYGLPSIGAGPQFPRDGGLMTYQKTLLSWLSREHPTSTAS